MPRPYTLMTNKTKAEIVRLYKEGLTFMEIADQIGDLDPSRVGQLAKKLGLPRRRDSNSLWNVDFEIAPNGRKASLCVQAQISAGAIRAALKSLKLGRGESIRALRVGNVGTPSK